MPTQHFLSTHNSSLIAHYSLLIAQNVLLSRNSTLKIFQRIYSKCLIFKLTGSALRIWGEVMVIFLVSPGSRSKKLSVKRAP